MRGPNKNDKMAVIEKIPEFETQNILPMPGSIPHLEYLAELEPPEITTLQDLQGFLLDNYVVESFVRLIRRHRTFFPMPIEGHVALDSRLIPGRTPPKQIFRGAMHIDSTHGQNTMLMLHGRPNPLDTIAYEDYTYDLLIPLTPSFELDPARPLEATYSRGSAKDIKSMDRWVYRSHAFPEYDEHDPDVFLCATQETAHDMAALIRYANGEASNSLAA